MKFPEKYRLKQHPTVPYFKSKEGDDFGLFRVPVQYGFLICMAAVGEGWEHVSVSCKRKNYKELNRCPTWNEMCQIKDLFWDKSEAVIQYHPPEENYVSDHHYTLHLWKPTDQEIPVPDPILVGRPNRIKK